MNALTTPSRTGGNGARGLATRAVVTIAAILLYGWVNFLLAPVSTLLTGEAAGRQFANGDAAYVASVFGMNLFGHIGIPFVALLAVLALIWWRPLRALLATAALIAVLQPSPAAAMPLGSMQPAISQAAIPTA